MNYIPEDWNLYYPRLNGPVPMEMLAPVVQTAVGVELCTFILSTTDELKAELGFGWVAAPIDGLRCTDLHAAYGRSVARKVPLPVADQSMEHTIFGSTTAALAARYWQCVNLVRRAESCEAASELKLDLTLVDLAAVEGVSLEACWYLEADLIGHSVLRWMGYANPHDSKLFTMDVLTFGEADAIVLEAERQAIPPRPPRGHVSPFLQRPN